MHEENHNSSECKLLYPAPSKFSGVTSVLAEEEINHNLFSIDYRATVKQTIEKGMLLLMHIGFLAELLHLGMRFCDLINCCYFRMMRCKALGI